MCNFYLVTLHIPAHQGLSLRNITLQHTSKEAKLNATRGALRFLHLHPEKQFSIFFLFLISLISALIFMFSFWQLWVEFALPFLNP